MAFSLCKSVASSNAFDTVRVTACAWLKKKKSKLKQNKVWHQLKSNLWFYYSKKNMKINSYQSTIPISIEARSIVFLFFFLLLVIPLHDNLSHQESYQPLAQPSGFLLSLPLYSVIAKIKISWHIFLHAF